MTDNPARLTEPDFDEASSRLRRLAPSYLLAYEIAGPAAWDGPRDPAWTLRQPAEPCPECAPARNMSET
jgi:hypothetical protein